MNRELENLPQEEETEAALITLTGEDGESIEYELLDTVEYDGRQYAVLIENSEEAEDVEIFRISEEGEDSVLTPVEEEAEAAAVFGIFKRNNADAFDFA